jgi:hypothetical protein
MPMRRSAVTVATTTADTQNMNHHKPAMRRAPGPSGCSIEGELAPQAPALRQSKRRAQADFSQLDLDGERTLPSSP